MYFYLGIYSVRKTGESISSVRLLRMELLQVDMLKYFGIHANTS